MLTISSDRQWLLSFVAQVEQSDELYEYGPRSGFLFTLDKLPRIIIEPCTKTNKSDRYRMLLDAALLVRVVNKIKTEDSSFVAIAIYIYHRFIAKTYLVYQPKLDHEMVGIPNSLIPDHGS